MRKIFAGLFLWSMVALVFADAPVVDYSSSSSSAIGNADLASSSVLQPENRLSPAATSTGNFTGEQRLNRLERQIGNINEQNLFRRVEELQQLLQKVNGQLEEQGHKIEQLNTQVKEFYQDLNQRLPGSKSNSIPGGSDQAIVKDANLIPVSSGSIAAASPSNEAKKEDQLKPANSDSALLQEQQLYQMAIDLLPDKKAASASKLRDYLKSYPQGVYVADAHYWLGEINFHQKNFDAAEEEFKIVVDKYPKSKRALNGLLKLALVHQHQGKEEAKQELQQLVKKYPGTAVARLAKKQLVGS